MGYTKEHKDKLYKLVTGYIDSEWHGEGFPVTAELIVDDILQDSLIATAPDMSEVLQKVYRIILPKVGSSRPNIPIALENLCTDIGRILAKADTKS